MYLGIHITKQTKGGGGGCNPKIIIKKKQQEKQTEKETTTSKQTKKPKNPAQQLRISYNNSVAQLLRRILGTTHKETNEGGKPPNRKQQQQQNKTKTQKCKQTHKPNDPAQQLRISYDDSVAQLLRRSGGKASTWRAGHSGFHPLSPQSVHTSDFNIGTSVATLPYHWRSRTSVRNSWPGIQIP